MENYQPWWELDLRAGSSSRLRPVSTTTLFPLCLPRLTRPFSPRCPLPRTDYIRFYHLRCYDRINAPKSFIDQMARDSGVSFFQAQIAQARLFLGDDTTWKQDKIQISAPATYSGKRPSRLGGNHWPMMLLRGPGTLVFQPTIPPTLERRKSREPP